MSLLLFVWLLLNIPAVVLLPRRWSFLPFIATVCLVPRVGVELGPLSFSALRLLICVGALRAVIKREAPAGGMNAMDALMLVWSAWLMGSIAFHNAPETLVITRAGNMLDAVGLYAVARISMHERADIVRFVKAVGVLFIVLAVAMVFEKVTHFNPFSVLGGISEVPVVRGGKARAQGPFDVSILAGTVGAGCIPLFVGLWSSARSHALSGILASVVIVFVSTSSGPILTVGAGVVALMAWPVRRHLWVARLGAGVAYVVLAMVMNDPPYYLMARIDLTGSSTGWHRAAIIDAAISHWNEWVLTGTDRTIHWMPYGIPWSADHTDITNQYLQMGVLGGLALMLLFMGCMWAAFIYVGRETRRSGDGTDPWLAWAIGASLTAHAVTFLSIAYYDQSMAFFYFNLAMAAAMAAPPVSRRARTSRRIARRLAPDAESPPAPSQSERRRGRPISAVAEGIGQLDPPLRRRGLG